MPHCRSVRFASATLAMLLAASACRSTSTRQPDAPDGPFTGDGVEFDVVGGDGALRALGTVDGQEVAFLETGMRRFDGVLVDTLGARRPASVLMDTGGRVWLEVEGEEHELERGDEAGEAEERRYRGALLGALPVEARLLEGDALVVGRVDVLGAPRYVVTPRLDAGGFSGLLEGARGPELAVRGSLGEDALELQVGSFEPFEARRR